MIVNGHALVSFKPFCISQNLSGAYSFVHTFLCAATGTLTLQKKESQNIRFMAAPVVKALLQPIPTIFPYATLHCANI